MKSNSLKLFHFGTIFFAFNQSHVVEDWGNTVSKDLHSFTTPLLDCLPSG